MNNLFLSLRNAAASFRAARTFQQLVLLCAGVSILILVGLSVIFSTPRNRYLFYFMAIQKNSVKVEVRFLPKMESAEENLALFISELMLGSRNPALAPLYPRETTLLSCIVRKNSAYIDLSASALMPAVENAKPDEVYALFKKNVCTNFRNVDRIYLYVDGIEVFRETPGIAEAEK